MQTHLPSCWVELYLSLVATLPMAPPPGLVRFVPFEPGSARLGGTPKAATARARQVLKRVPGPLVVATLAQVMHL